MHKSYSNYKAAFKGISLPAAFVDLDALESNAKTMLERAGDKKIRIASKSVRSVEILKHILGLDDRFQGIMTYAASETAFLAAKGLDDLLLAYPPVRAEDLEPLVEYWRAGRKICIMQDDPARFRTLQAFAEKQKIEIPICMDLDLSVDFPGLHFGVWRSPIRTAEKVREFLEVLPQFPRLKLSGLMGYEAQIAGVGDQINGQPLKSKVIQYLKKYSLPRIQKRRAAAVEMIKDHGYTLDLINGGGTGSLESTSRESVVTEVTAGSGFYQSTLFDQYKNFIQEAAAGFVLGVSRIPAPGIYTCHMGGFIASGAIGKEKSPAVWMPAGAKLDKNEGAGEVQTPVHYDGDLDLGDPLFFRHAKAGELCEHFNTLLLLREGKISGNCPTYRGAGFAIN
ncbi:MAG: amino acid deaminase/aldolase [Bacteroidetes bacterium]|nr:amino acid deaminase/aldolase [Bacteroidota bacterium]